MAKRSATPGPSGPAKRARAEEIFVPDHNLILDMLPEVLEQYPLNLLDLRALARSSNAAADAVYHALQLVSDNPMKKDDSPLHADWEAVKADATLSSAEKTARYISMWMFLRDLRDAKTLELCPSAKYMMMLIRRSPTMLGTADPWAYAYDLVLRLNRIATQIALSELLYGLEFAIEAPETDELDEFGAGTIEWFIMPGEIPAAGRDAALVGRNYMNLTRAAPHPQSTARPGLRLYSDAEMTTNDLVYVGLSHDDILVASDATPDGSDREYVGPFQPSTNPVVTLMSDDSLDDKSVVIAELALSWGRGEDNDEVCLDIDIRYINVTYILAKVNSVNGDFVTEFVDELMSIGRHAGDASPSMEFYRNNDPAVRFAMITWPEEGSALPTLETNTIPMPLATPLHIGREDVVLLENIYVSRHPEHLLMRQEISPELRAQIEEAHPSEFRPPVADARWNQFILGLPGLSTTPDEPRIHWSSPLLHCSACTSESPTHIDSATAPLRSFCDACTATHRSMHQ